MSTPSTAEALAARAWMDVRKGRIWQGARVPVELALREGALIMRVTTMRIEKRERSALVRLCGDEVLSTLIAKRDEPEVALPLARTRFAYPSMFGAGRTQIRVHAPGRPLAVLTFTDPSELGSPMANPLRFTFRLLREGPRARARRDTWRDAIEAAATPYRSSAVPS